MGVGGQRHAPAALSLGKSSDTGGWVGLEPVFTVAENLSHTGVRTQVIRPVGSRYTVCGIPAAVTWGTNYILNLAEMRL